MHRITEPAREIPVIEEADICVLGGSCTGVFAAVRAARLGARVVIIEKQNSFGGVATQGFVNIWHSLLDSRFENQIIGGLTQEVLARLRKIGAVREEPKSDSVGFVLNTDELKIELDSLIIQAGVTPMLHTFFCAPYIQHGQLAGVITENKSGRGVVLAKYFIDATGDGDLCERLRLSRYLASHIQPPTSCARFYGMAETPDLHLQELIKTHREEFLLREDWGWRIDYPGMKELSVHAETHVFDVNCANAVELTHAEIEGRRQIRAVMDIVRKYGKPKEPIALAGLASSIGMRETRHFTGEYRANGHDLLYGTPFEDAIAFGSYRVDVHQSDRPGIVFQYLDGREVYHRTGYADQHSFWRDDRENCARYYQLPYRMLLPKQSPFHNVLMAGRMIDADAVSFGALRVMVNLNQLGEAAGVAAYLALRQSQPVTAVDAAQLRDTLRQGGSLLPDA